MNMKGLKPFIGAFVALAIVNAGMGMTEAFAKAKTKTSTSQSLAVQNFQDGSLDVQFRYVNKTLTYIRFANTGDNPIKIDVLQRSYILGKGDAVVINPPKIRVLKVTQEPYVESSPSTSAHKILPNRFQKESVFKLPKTQDDKVQQ